VGSGVTPATVTGDIAPTLPLLINNPQAALVVANSAVTFPLTITAGSNDEFVWTPASTSIPETFTIPPATYANITDLYSLGINVAIGSTSGNPFDTYAGIFGQWSGNTLYLIAFNNGTADNGDTISYGVHNACVDLGFTGNPNTLSGGVDGNDTFVFAGTPGGLAAPETFTFNGGGTFSTLSTLATAMAGALGSVSGEPFSTYVAVSNNGTELVLTMADGSGSAGNGNKISYGSPDAAADLGFTGNPDIFSGGTNAGAVSSDSCELWYARGIQGGAASVDVHVNTTAGIVNANVSEWSGVWWSDPLDQWSQNIGTGSTAAPQTIVPRTSGDLIVSLVSSSASVSGPSSPFTALSMGVDTQYGLGYEIAGPTADDMYWETDPSATWAVAEASFVPGVAGLNPLLQFPEMLVEVSQQENYLAPFNGTGIWTNVSQYFRNGTFGPLGRQHELDRIQSTSATLTMNNRTGMFNTWNTSSFLYPGGLDPMTPLKVTAAWSGVTYPINYSYIQSVTPVIGDVLNVDATIASYDLLQMLSLAYLSGSNYPALVLADGGTELGAFYRLGDNVGSYVVEDSSGSGNTGSLIAGFGGTPAYGYGAPFLYDPSTAIDLTNGTNVLNGGIQTIDNTTQPPTVHQPASVSATTGLTFECWLKWTGSGGRTPGQVFTFSGYYATDRGEDTYPIFTLTGLSLAPSDPIAVGDAISGTDMPSGAIITDISYAGGYLFFSPAAASTASGQGPITFSSTGGAVGSTLFSGTQQEPISSVSNGIDIRVGAVADGSTTGYNRVSYGTVTGLFADPDYTPIGYSSGAINVQDGSWHHVVVALGSGVANQSTTSIYIDGALNATGASVQSTELYNVNIGCDISPVGPINGWVGALANVAIYTTILTPTQVANHYTVGKWFQSEEYGAGSGGTSAGRFNKVMSVIGLDSNVSLYVPYPFRTTMYAETNPVTTTSALNYLQTQSETEPGLIFQLPNGLIAAYSRQYQYLNPTSTASQAIFGDSSAASVLYHYDGPSLQIATDDLDTWTKIQVQSGRSGSQLQEWGPSQSAAMAAAASVSGERTLQGLTSLQMEYDSDALAIGQTYGNWYSTPRRRVTALTTDSYGNRGNNIPQMLGRGLYDRMTIQYQGQTPGPQFSQDSLIESIAHNINIDNGPIWTTTWQMSPYEILQTAFIFGVTSQLSGASVSVPQVLTL
jgi:hypothetical protein